VFDAQSTYQTPCINCVNPDGSGNRAFRGGGFTYGATEIRTTSLKANPPTYRFINLGVRCARRASRRGSLHGPSITGPRP
jgi:formylglycine-generating enzyme required for sulfatase activity